MSKEFGELNKRIAKLRSEHVRAFQYFYAFDQISELRAPNLVGKEEAHKNAQAIGQYKGFFNPAYTALMTGFYVALAKIFDTHEDALHINKLISYAEGNQKNLTVDDFAKYNEDRQYLEELKAKYKGIQHKDLVSIKKRLEEAQFKLEKLKNLRDKTVVHIDLHIRDIEYLTYEEIISLIDLSHDILNVFSSSTNHETSEYFVIKDQVINDTKCLVKLIRDEEAH